MLVHVTFGSLWLVPHGGFARACSADGVPGFGLRANRPVWGIVSGR